MGKFSDVFLDPGGVVTGDSEMPLAANLGLGSSSNGKKATPKAPAAPDYIKLIQEQARQNRVDTKTPYGSNTYEQTPDGRWISTTSLTPQMQDLLDRQLNIAGTGTSDKDYGQYEDMAMAMARRHLDPVYDRQRAQLEQEMANRGTPVGSEIYADKYKLMSDAQDQGYQDAAFKALQFGTGLRAQDDSRTLQDYNMLASVLNNMQAQGTAPIDVMGPFGAQQQQLMNNYNQQLNASNQANSNFWNAAGTVGAGALMAFSDMRLKSSIRYVRTVLGVRFYRWTWNAAAKLLGLQGEGEGVMAQEILQRFPHLVVFDRGYFKVDYSGLAQQLEAA